MLANYPIERTVPYALIFLPYKLLVKISEVKKKFHLNWLKIKLLRYIRKEVTNIYVSSEGFYKLVSEIKDLPEAEAMQLFSHCEKALHKYVKLYSAIENINFFGIKYIRETSEKTLQNYLSIESHSRYLTYSASVNKVDDSVLKEFSAEVSLNTLVNHVHAKSDS